MSFACHASPCTQHRASVLHVVFSLAVVLLFLPAAGANADGPGVDLTVEAQSGSSVSLSWSVSGVTEVSSYELRLSALGFSVWRPMGDNTSFTYPRISTRCNYTFQIKAHTPAGTLLSNEVVIGPGDAGPPVAPSSLVANAVSKTQIDLTWSDNSSDERTFQVERWTSGAGQFTVVATLRPRTQSWSDCQLSENTTYYYRVCAANSAGNSSYTALVSTTTLGSAPDPPSNLSATAASSSRIDIQWSDNSTDETGFKVERSIGGPFVTIATVSVGATTYSNTGLPDSTTYYYRVRAYSSTGSSAYSNSASAATLGGPPDPPSNLSATAASSSRIDLQWSDNSTNETEFKVERSIGGPFVTIATVSAGATTYSNTGLSDSTTYDYRVRAHNSSGSSAYSNTAGATTHGTLPAAPGNLIATAVSSEQIDLQWDDNSTNESGFVVERAPEGGTYSEIADLGSGAISYSDTGLFPGSTLCYRVRAYNSSGYSAYADPSCATLDSGETAVDPQLVGFVYDVGSVSDVVVVGTTAYLASDPFGVVVMDVSDPLAPSVVNSQHPLGPAGSLALSEDETVAVVTGTPRGTDIVDISNALYPEVLASVEGSSGDVAIAGNIAYVTSMGNVNVVDFSVPSNPQVVTTLVTDDIALGIAVSGQTAVVADGFFGLRVVDITNPYAPSIVGSVSLGGIAAEVAISGNLALVANSGLGKLQVVDIGVPSNPTLVGSLNVGSLRHVTASGTTAYVSANGNGLVIVDVSNPASPTLVSTHGYYAQSCAVSDGIAFVALGDFGFTLVDVSVPDSPTTIGTYDTPGSCNDVVLLPGRAITTDGTSLLCIFDL